MKYRPGRLIVLCALILIIAGMQCGFFDGRTHAHRPPGIGKDDRLPNSFPQHTVDAGIGSIHRNRSRLTVSVLHDHRPNAATQRQ